MSGVARGLVIGKFLPPHAGHHLVIEEALRRCSVTDIVVCDRAGQEPRAPLRAGWLRRIHPSAEVHLVEDLCAWHGESECPAACSAAWATHLRAVGLGPWDAVFGSAPYLGRFAAELGAAAFAVDPERRSQPISGTALRRDLARGWPFLHPVVRAGLTRRVVVLGAESTGTTTLAKDLAEVLGAPWVPECGRTHTEELARRAGSVRDIVWQTEDFDQIASEQERAEVRSLEAWAAAGKPAGDLGPFLVCDTDALATAIWQRRYLAREAPDLVARARARPPFLYVCTLPDGLPFVQDGLRDGEHVRNEMTSWFREALDAQPVAWIQVRGDRIARVEAVRARLADLAAAQPLFSQIGI